MIHEPTKQCCHQDPEYDQDCRLKDQFTVLRRQRNMTENFTIASKFSNTVLNNSWIKDLNVKDKAINL